MSGDNDTGMTKQELASAFQFEGLTRSNAYDPEWVIENMMGPNVMWLTESLSQVMRLEPGMRVLDMGCGKAVSSIFLAKEFGLQVWAADLWIDPSDNLERIRAFDLDDQVFPIRVEAHDIPFASDFFDAIVSMDSYHYYGADALYLRNRFSRLVRPGGQIGIVVPGLTKEFPLASPPTHLQPFWDSDFWSFHSPDWWRRNWERSGVVEVERADMIPDGWKLWLTSAEVSDRWLGKKDTTVDEAELMRVDEGRHLGFTRMVARRNPSA
jgi:SAM-dependent methyltransferase